MIKTQNHEMSLAWEHRGHDRGVSWAARSNTLFFSLIVRTWRRTRFEITGAQRCMIGQCHTVHKKFFVVTVGAVRAETKRIILIIFSGLNRID